MIAEICFGLAGLAALAYWPLVTGPATWPRSALKTLSTALLALAGLWQGGPWALVLGLGLGCLGDLALSRPGDSAFRAGLGAFLLGHLAYAWLFLAQPDSAAAVIALPANLVAAALLLLFSAAMARLLWLAAGGLRGPVMAYVGVIAAMGLAALTLPLPHPGQAAAALFIASDAVLAVEVFLVPAAARLTAPVVWPLYWLAQALFLGCFAFQNPV